MFIHINTHGLSNFSIFVSRQETTFKYAPDYILGCSGIPVKQNLTSAIPKLLGTDP